MTLENVIVAPVEIPAEIVDASETLVTPTVETIRVSAPLTNESPAMIPVKEFTKTISVPIPAFVVAAETSTVIVSVSEPPD